MMNLNRNIILVALILSCVSAYAPSNVQNEETLSSTNEEFNNYWYSGKAEVSTYTIKQARYGEMHEGMEVLIFVTEDYNLDKQVKYESSSDDKHTSVLKLNRIKRFTTGIYDYSMYTSVFKAIDTEKYPNTFKVSSSSQDWCGQSWSKILLDNGGYTIHTDSYFESERELGMDKKITSRAVLEDEIMSLIRIDPKLLPKGDIEVIPSLNYARLTHAELKPESANAKQFLQVMDDSSERLIFLLEYSSGRRLKIFFQSVFPYRIQGWELKQKSGKGENAKWLTSTADLSSSINTDYWNKNKNTDIEMRKMLGL